MVEAGSVAKKAKKVKAGAEDGLKVKAKAKKAQLTPAATVGVQDAGKKKKRKLEVVDTEPEPAVKKAKTSKRKKAASAPGSDSSNASETTEMPGAAPAKPADPMAIDNFRLSPATKALLREKGIEALFPIQAGTLHHLLDGADLVGRARTGCGKTLAFVLPIVERLMDGEGGKRAFGRKPQVIVLAPTRELAKQVHADFDFMGRAAALRALCLYGGTPYAEQERVLARGCDIVVGTPGRVKDHLERGTLNLQALRFRVLDECDEMLYMGFVDDVERILNAGSGSSPVQTLLFSATLPAWVKDITKRFLKPGHQTIDLVGSQKMKASTTVRHLVLPCHWTQRSAVAGDLIRAYAACGRAIVFTDTKRDAGELAAALSDSHGARPLHGDIPQAQREVTLKGFREGKFDVLVATDVAARGLDISGVELVVQCEPPKDPEIYIHRSGRTGRAGSTGVSVILADKRKEGLVPFIARKAGVAFERVGAPQPAEMARIAGERAVEALQQMDTATVPLFRAAAAQLLAEADDPERVLAAALAKITGFSSMRARSLLTAHEDFTTLQFHAPTEIQRPGYVFTCLKRALPDALVEDIKRLALTADGLCAVFDVPSEHAEEFLAKCGRSAGDAGPGGGVSLARGGAAAQPYLTQPAELPELKAREGGELQSPGFGGDGARGGYGGGPSGGFRGGGWYGAGGGHGQAWGRDRGRGGGRGGAQRSSRGGSRGRQ